MRRSSRYLLLAISVLSFFAASIVYANLAEERRGLLTVSFLDVGQGDSIFIDAPSGRQMLIDGGPNSSVLRQLSRVMPWYDRSIDVVVATHPDLDHIGGLIDVLPRYRVGTIMLSSVNGSTSGWASFRAGVAKETQDARIAERGQVVNLGEGVYLEILFPDRELPAVETNVGCIVSRLVYGATAFILPCDATAAIEEYVARLDGKKLGSQVLKAAHHGSKTSSAAFFVGAVDPEYVVYSRGCGNSYGHPHEQTVDTFARFGIVALDTCEEGTVTFVSDGKRVVRK